MAHDTKSKPWGGRFTEDTDSFVEQFTASVDFDRRMYLQDIQGSIAHANMLAAVGILSGAECDAIKQGLSQIQAEIEKGAFEWRTDLEDVHMNIEARLVALIGEPGKKLHTGRSRNDQVATDLRLYLRAAMDQIDHQLKAVQLALVELAEREAETLMPGFTHLQVAQVVSLGHHMLAWFEMIKRDRERFQDCRKRTNVMPLGSAALAGTGFPLDRNMTAGELGFDSVTANSLDAVSDRDFAIEFCAAAAICMIHFSRMSEELVLWASQQFDFVDLPDRFCTGSSIMPQKKNPDVPELVRGKSGRVCGNLMALLTLMKSQPLAYNKDNQEDKEPLFDTIDTLLGCSQAFAGLLPHMRFKHENLRIATYQGYATATDLADYLVRKNIPFRDAHAIVGQAVKLAVERNIGLEELPLEDLQKLNSAIESDVFEVLTPQGSVYSKRVIGGASPKCVRDQIALARNIL